MLAFASLEIAVVGIALAMYGRYAADGEKISLQGSCLVAELETAGSRECAGFNHSWVWSPRLGAGPHHGVSAGQVGAGRHLARLEVRSVLASETRMALQAA